MRKKLLFTLLALLGMTQAVAQEYEYVPFVREGVKWHYSYKDKTFFDYEHKSTLELKGDATFDGKTYKAMHKYSGESINWDNDTIPVYLREEDKVVYGIVPDGKTYVECPVGIEYDSEMMELIAEGKEFVLYDFNEPIKFIESWTRFLAPYWCIVIPDLTTVGGKRANRYIFDNKCLIEGIGYDSMLKAYPLALQKNTSYPVYLSHVIENGEVIYRSESHKQERDNIPPLVREGVKWVNERVTINHGDTTRTYYNYEFKGTDYYHNNPLCYQYTGDELDLNTATVAAMFVTSYDTPYSVREYNAMFNVPLTNVVEQGRNLITLGYQLYKFDGNNSDILMRYPINFYIYNQNEGFLNRQNFVEVDPVEIEGIESRRYAYLGEDGEPLAYIVEGIGFDSRDMGDLLTPFTRKPDPDAEYQEYWGLSHVIKDGKIIYKGMRYRGEAEESVRGDVNSDGRVDINDVAILIDMLLNMGGRYTMPYDVDNNGNVGVSDVTTLIDLLLTQEQ